MKVKNISETLRVLYDKGGKRVEIGPGESVDMMHPPNHYAFEVDGNIEKKEKGKEEQKTERRTK